MALGTFGCSCIKARFGSKIDAGVGVALRHFAHSLESGPRPVAFPEFRRGQSPDGLGAEFELVVEPEVKAVLEGEARRSGISVEQLVVHAVFVYLAELESGFNARHSSVSLAVS